jgi:hypothetical protein
MMVRRNIEIEIPAEVDNLIGTLARLRGVTKKSVTREALIEYGQRHAADIDKLIARTRRIAGGQATIRDVKRRNPRGDQTSSVKEGHQERDSPDEDSLGPQ